MKKLDSVLVIGGGIAGIQAALDLADQGVKVHMVEKTPSIGGRMAQLDKTFPTNDCSMCMLAPKVVACGRHPNIHLMTYSEVERVRGRAGDFKVRIRRKARYVDEKKCTGCGACYQICPVSVPNEFDMNLAERKAIYVPFPQAVPNVATIDKTVCINCQMCTKVCKAKAPIHDQKDEIVEVNVGSIIVATGYDIYQPYDMTEYGYGKYPNVVTALEFERMLSASGPTGGRVLRRSDGRVAHKIAFIQCVGCRSVAKGRPWCSRFCCTYATKEAVIAKEHEPAIKEAHIFYIDIRTFGKGFEEYYVRAKEDYGINYVKGIPADISEDETGTLTLRYEDLDTGEVKLMENVDLVILSSSVIPKKGIDKLTKILRIELDDYGFINEVGANSNPVDTTREGVFVCGCASGMRDIPDSVAQASGAAAKAALYVEPAKVEKKEVKEKDVRGEEPRIGVFVCHCGVNIGGVVDVPSVAEYASKLPGVIYAEHNLYTCSGDAQERIKEKIKEHNLNRVVVASCTPRTHELLFRETCKQAGLNPYLFEMANIRDQCSWVHMEEPAKATEKAKDLVRMAVAKAKKLEPLHETEMSTAPAALVIGGGISGMNAALGIAEKGFTVYLVEKEKELGGLIRNLDSVYPDDRKASELLDSLIKKVNENKNITIYTSSTVDDIQGYIGNYQVKIGKEEIIVGTIVVATGAESFKPEGYFGYGEYENVVTLLEFEKLAKEGKIKGTKFVFIQCVGSREGERRTYCSRVCCMASISTAHRLKEGIKDADVTILHRDIRTVGKTHEEYYRKTRLEGIKYVRYEAEEPPVVKQNKDKTLSVRVFNRTYGKEMLLKTDMVVLASAMVAPEDNKVLSQFLKVPLDQHGFFLEAHLKLRPVDFATEGVYVCGTASSPKDISDSVSQALGAASRAMIPLVNAKVTAEGNIAVVDANLCVACGICMDTCPYGAPQLILNEEGKIVSKINEALCKGCGACIAECPVGVITARHFKDEQEFAKIRALYEV